MSLNKSKNRRIELFNLKIRSCMNFIKKPLYLHVTIANDNQIYISDALGVMLPSTAHLKDLFKDKKLSKTIKKINKALGENHLFTSLAG